MSTCPNCGYTAFSDKEEVSETSSSSAHEEEPEDEDEYYLEDLGDIYRELMSDLMKKINKMEVKSREMYAAGLDQFSPFANDIAFFMSTIRNHKAIEQEKLYELEFDTKYEDVYNRYEIYLCKMLELLKKIDSTCLHLLSYLEDHDNLLFQYELESFINLLGSFHNINKSCLNLFN